MKAPTLETSPQAGTTHLRRAIERCGSRPGACAGIGSGVLTFSRPVKKELTLLDVGRQAESQLVTLRYAASGNRRER